MITTTKKQLKFSILASSLIALVSYIILMINVEYITLFFTDLKQFIGLSILFFAVFFVQSVMDIYAFITIKLEERKKV